MHRTIGSLKAFRCSPQVHPLVFGSSMTKPYAFAMFQVISSFRVNDSADVSCLMILIQGH